MNIAQFLQKITPIDIFVKYQPKATTELLKQAAQQALTLTNEERAFLKWLAVHIQFVHDLYSAINFLATHYSPNSSFRLSEGALAKTIYNTFYAGFEAYNATPVDILALHGFDEIAYFNLTNALARDVESRAQRNNITLNYDFFRVDAQSPDFFYIIIRPQQIIPYDKYRFYLTVNPQHIRECVMYIFEKLGEYAWNKSHEIHFKFSTVTEYRKDSIVIYADKGIAPIIRQMPTDWFLQYNLPFCVKLANGRSMVKNVAAEIVNKLSPYTDKSHGSAISRLLADALFRFSAKAGKLTSWPKTDQEKIAVIMDVCSKLFEQSIICQEPPI